MSATTSNIPAQGAPSGAPTGPGASAGSAGAGAGDPTVGALVRDLSQQIPELVRSELRLAQVEMTQKGKKVGIGLGMFGAAGLFAFFALGTAVTAAVLALDLVLPAWGAALVVTAALLLVAGTAALLGRERIDEGTPPVPERTLENVQQDVQALKGVRP